MTEQQPPLWEVIDAAWWSLVDTESSTCPPSRDQAACVIRAVRDWLVPEEPESAMGATLFQQGEWCARQLLRQRLIHEACQAEAGE